MRPLLALVIAMAVGLALPTPSLAQGPPEPRELGIKYVRDSLEYQTLAQQVYRLASDVLLRAGTGAEPWGVVLDVDETALDNSTYELERVTYGLPFAAPSWNAWVRRRAAEAVPGAIAFVQKVRAAGGHIAWITNREAVPDLAEATRANLEHVGLWNNDDRLCGQKDPQHTKASRRREVATGSGDCSWPGVRMRVVAFVGDQMGDFPTADEGLSVTGASDDFGRTCFLLPNPMYGGWTRAITRR